MTADFQEIDGVGPSREEDLNEAGYEEYADLAEADSGELADQIPRLSEDSALEIIVQAQNLADLEEAYVEANPVPEEEEEPEDHTIEVGETITEDDPTPDEEAVEEEEKTEDEAAVHELTLHLEGPKEYDVLFHCFIRYRNKLLGTNRPAGHIDGYLATLREAAPGEDVTFELTAAEINELNNAIHQNRLNYQGQGYDGYFDAMRDVEAKFSVEREDLIF